MKRVLVLFLAVMPMLGCAKALRVGVLVAGGLLNGKPSTLPMPDPTTLPPAPTQRQPQCDDIAGPMCDCWRFSVAGDVWDACVRETPTPRPTAHPTPLPTAASDPDPTREPYAPMFDGGTGPGAVGPKGQIELTMRVARVLPKDIAHELPYSPEQNPQWWANLRWLAEKGRYEPAAWICSDSSHWFVDLNQGRGRERSILWWICGGSDTYMTSPREWDPREPFSISHSDGVTVESPCWRQDHFNACVHGSGTVTVCAPADLYTCTETLDRTRGCTMSSKVALQRKRDCVTRPVSVAAPTPKPTKTPRVPR